MNYLDILIRLKDSRIDPLAAKEAVTYDCEKYGDVIFVDVKAGPEPEQLQIGNLPPSLRWRGVEIEEDEK